MFKTKCSSFIWGPKFYSCQTDDNLTRITQSDNNTGVMPRLAGLRPVEAAPASVYCKLLRDPEKQSSDCLASFPFCLSRKRRKSSSSCETAETQIQSLIIRAGWRGGFMDHRCTSRSRLNWSSVCLAAVGLLGGRSVSRFGKESLDLSQK